MNAPRRYSSMTVVLLSLIALLLLAIWINLPKKTNYSTSPRRQTQPTQRRANVQLDEQLAFDRFRMAFDALMYRVESKGGSVIFTGTEYLGNGVVSVTATDDWISAGFEAKSSNLKTLYGIWESAHYQDGSFVVQVVDSNGTVVMSRSSH